MIRTKKDKIRKMASQAVDELVAAVEAGKSEQLKAYLAAMGRFHRYSLGNQLLISFQRPDATRVTGYRTWMQLGRRVKRGEKAIRIMAPIVWRTKNEDEDEKVVSFRSACIFDVSQTDGKPLAEFAKVNGEQEDTLALRDAGLDALLVAEPSKAVLQLTERYECEGVDLVLRMTSLTDHHHRPEAVVGSWPSPLLEQLVNLLHQAFPAETDPEREAGVAYQVGQEDELREMRRRIPMILLDRGTPEDHEILNRLSEQYPTVHKWYNYTRSQQAAQTVLSQITAPDGPSTSLSTTLPVKKVVRLLDDGIYRLMRSDKDLQRVLLEELDEIANSVKEHLSMLYQPPERSGKGKAGGGFRQQRRRLQEDALQRTFIAG